MSDVKRRLDKLEKAGKPGESQRPRQELSEDGRILTWWRGKKVIVKVVLTGNMTFRDV